MKLKSSLGSAFVLGESCGSLSPAPRSGVSSGELRGEISTSFS